MGKGYAVAGSCHNTYTLLYQTKKARQSGNFAAELSADFSLCGCYHRTPSIPAKLAGQPATTASMSSDIPNKHAKRSAQTRLRFIEAAQTLFAQRSVDSVSVNEITVAAGQKNRNALQYHFGNRSGLIQAIIDHHVTRVNQLRGPILESLDSAEPAARNAARALVEPLIKYVENEATGVHYVKIISQLAAINMPSTNPDANRALSFSYDDRLRSVVREAISHLSPEESQRRLFLIVTLTFHGIGDICRAHESPADNDAKAARHALMREVVNAIEAVLAAPSSQG